MVYSNFSTPIYPLRPDLIPLETSNRYKDIDVTRYKSTELYMYCPPW